MSMEVDDLFGWWTGAADMALRADLAETVFWASWRAAPLESHGVCSSEWCHDRHVSWRELRSDRIEKTRDALARHLSHKGTIQKASLKVLAECAEHKPTRPYEGAHILCGPKLRRAAREALGEDKVHVSNLLTGSLDDIAYMVEPGAVKLSYDTPPRICVEPDEKGVLFVCSVKLLGQVQRGTATRVDLS